MKCELSNNIKFLALKYHCLTKKSLERSFRWAKRNFDSYFKLIDKYKYEKMTYIQRRNLYFKALFQRMSLKRKRVLNTFPVIDQ